MKTSCQEELDKGTETVRVSCFSICPSLLSSIYLKTSWSIFSFKTIFSQLLQITILTIHLGHVKLSAKSSRTHISHCYQVIALPFVQKQMFSNHTIPSEIQGIASDIVSEVLLALVRCLVLFRCVESLMKVLQWIHNSGHCIHFLSEFSVVGERFPQINWVDLFSFEWTPIMLLCSSVSLTLLCTGFVFPTAS